MTSLEGEPDLIFEPWLHRTKPWKTEQIVALHRIFDTGGLSLADLSKNFQFSLPVLTAYLVSFLVIIFSSYLVTKLSYRIRFGANKVESQSNLARSSAENSVTSSIGRNGLGGNRRLFLAHFLTKRGSLTAISVFVLFAQLFIWFSGLFLINNIKTNQVVRLHLKKLVHQIESKGVQHCSYFITGGGQEHYYQKPRRSF